MDNSNLGVILFKLLVCFWMVVLVWWRVSGPKSKIKIITFTGPSEVGKTTIVGELLKRHPEWKMILSLTSRGLRESDLPGEYKCNIVKEEFFWRDRGGEFIWVVSAHGNMYGTFLSDIHEALNSKSLSLVQILPESVKQLCAYAPGKVLPIFLFPPDEEELRRRLAKKGESSEQIDRRIIDCKKWGDEALALDIPYRFVRNNGTVAEAVEQVENILKYNT